MNYLDYKQKMKEADLVESLAVKIILKKAVEIASVWKNIEKNPAINLDKISNELKLKKHIDMEIKDFWINFALFIAETEKRNGWKFLEDKEFITEALCKTAEIVGFENKYITSTMQLFDFLIDLEKEVNDKILYKKG